MIIDIRYHIASLAAVFIALGIGILVGSFMDGDDFLVRQQHHLISMLENDVHKIMLQKEDLVAQINSLQDDTKLMETFIDIVSPGIISDVLKDKAVSIMFVACSIDEAFVKAFQDLVETAGGTLGTVSSFGSLLDVSVDMQGFNTLLGLPPKPSDAELGRVMRDIGRAVTGSGDFDLVNHVLEKQALTVSGDSSVKPDVLILITNSSDRKHSGTRIDSALFNAVRDCGVRVVAAEVSTAKETYLTPYIQQAVATVDNIDMYFGRLALILVAAGVDGNFGIRKTASSFFPDAVTFKTLNRGLQDAQSMCEYCHSSF